MGAKLEHVQSHQAYPAEASGGIPLSPCPAIATGGIPLSPCPATATGGTHSLPLSCHCCWRYPLSPPISPLLLAVPLSMAVQASRQCQWRHPRKKRTPSVICYK